MKTAFSLIGVVAAALLTAAMLLTAGWVRPPIYGVQTGFRGTGQEQLISAQNKRILEAANALPEPIDRASPSGERATQAYKNVKVLTDLSTEEFNRVMVAITQWVSPDQGCAYCHNTENLADDGLYTKIVARHMLEMNAAHQQGPIRRMSGIPASPAIPVIVASPFRAISGSRIRADRMQAACRRTIMASDIRQSRMATPHCRSIHSRRIFSATTIFASRARRRCRRSRAHRSSKRSRAFRS